MTEHNFIKKNRIITGKFAKLKDVERIYESIFFSKRGRRAQSVKRWPIGWRTGIRVQAETRNDSLLYSVQK